MQVQNLGSEKASLGSLRSLVFIVTQRMDFSRLNANLHEFYMPLKFGPVTTTIRSSKAPTDERNHQNRVKNSCCFFL